MYPNDDNMKTRADIIDELEDKYGIKANELSRRELLIIGIATNDHDSEVEKWFLHDVSKSFCEKCMEWCFDSKCPKCGNTDLKYDATY